MDMNEYREISLAEAEKAHDHMLDREYRDALTCIKSSIYAMRQYNKLLEVGVL